MCRFLSPPLLIFLRFSLAHHCNHRQSPTRLRFLSLPSYLPRSGRYTPTVSFRLSPSAVACRLSPVAGTPSPPLYFLLIILSVIASYFWHKLAIIYFAGRFLKFDSWILNLNQSVTSVEVNLLCLLIPLFKISRVFRFLSSVIGCIY